MVKEFRGHPAVAWAPSDLGPAIPRYEEACPCPSRQGAEEIPGAPPAIKCSKSKQRPQPRTSQGQRVNISKVLET